MARRILSVDLERRFARGPTIAARFELDLDAGEVLALFGPSGAGKTTILRCLAGLDRPDRGTIVAAGQRWVDVAGGVFAPPQARRIGYLPQGSALFPHLSVAANVAFGVPGHAAPEHDDQIRTLLALLGLRGLERRRPAELSGGQARRVALARALARRPLLLLLDEPLSALDLPTREELRRELRAQLERFGTPTVLVTHDRTEALVLADRVAVILEGAVRQVGPTADVFARPADPAVARIVGVDTLVPGTVRAARDGLATVEVGGRELVAVSDLAPGSAVLVSLRPEDVLLVPAGHQLDGLSARNRLEGRVVAVEPLGALVRVGLDVGFPLRALVTRQAFDELGAGPGRALVALVKAPAVHLIAVGPPPAEAAGAG
ncbi:MAG: ABC transporter ATP-binding protein [Chloroflexota bacterium]